MIGVVEALYSQLVSATNKLEELRKTGVKTWIEEEASLRLLQVQAQALLDIAMRAASSLGYTPLTPKEAARRLEEEGILDSGERPFIERVTGFRNILAHGYRSINMDIVRRIILGREYVRVAELATKILREIKARGLDP